MAQYYYDKFTAIANNTYTEKKTSILSGANASMHDNLSLFLSQYSGGNPDYPVYRAYIVHSTTGTISLESMAASDGFTTYNSPITMYQLFKVSSDPGVIHFVYSVGAKVFICRLEYLSTGAFTIGIDRLESTIASTTYTKGSLVSSGIIAEDGTYPTNGRHTDGFWYVKGAVVGPMPPGTVSPNKCDIGSAGGRSLVRMNNGWLVAAMRVTDNIQFRVSKDNGVNWTSLCYIASSMIKNHDFAIATNGTTVFCIFGGLSGSYSIHHLRFDPTKMNGGPLTANGTIDVSQTALGSMSVTVDPSNGHLHAVWSSRNTSYNATYNVRYSKSTDGGVTWSAPTQVSLYNVTGSGCFDPSIVVKPDGKPLILCTLTNGSSYNSIHAYNFTTAWQSIIVYNGGTYSQNRPSAAIDKNGVIHVAWISYKAGGTNSNIRYARSIDGGATFTDVFDVKNPFLTDQTDPSITVDKNNLVRIVFRGVQNGVTAGNHELKQVEYKNGAWSDMVEITNAAGHATNQAPSTLYDPYFKVSFGSVTPVVYSNADTTQTTYLGTVATNDAPTVTLVLPENNRTLYENDVINISGDAYDSDKDQSVTVFYQLNGEQRKVLATNISQTQITLSKQLTFKEGKLYDGETVLTGTLAEGVAHTLKVWAVDSDNSQSATIERTFYVVPNRAPLLSVDAVVPAGVVDTDKFKISGTSSDQDANSTVKVSRRINSENPVEIYSGPGGTWEFDLSLAQLIVGENTIIIEVIDNYGAKTSKTIKLKKNEVKTPILHAVARYKITPPAGTAKGVLLFIERDEDMDLKVELSMTLAGEQEQYQTLTADNTAPMPNTNGIVEDTYYHEATEPKDNIILKLSTTRPDAAVNHKIHLISGAVE